MSTKPTIYLHIGAGKTGSTTIQVWLKSVEAALAEAGYLIFDTDFSPGAQHDQLSNQQQYFHEVLLNGVKGIESFQDQFRSNLNYMQEHGYHSAVLSAENLFNHWTGAHQWFRPFLDECNWKIIAYVRNQPYYIISAWKEWGYWRQDFEDLLAGDIHADWLKTLTAWDETFGSQNIYLGILEKRCMVDGLLHHDFATAINTPHIIANDHDLVHANPSINNRSALLFSKIRHQYIARNPRAAAMSDTNSIDPKETRIQTALKHNAKLNSMFHFKPLVVGHAPVSGTQEFDSPLSLYNQELLDFIHARFDASNRALLARYRPDIDPEVAFPRIIYSEHTTVSDHNLMLHGFHIAFESLNSIDTQINAKVKQINKLQQQFTALQSDIDTLTQTSKKLGAIWQSTIAHDQSIAHLQAQVDQLNQTIAQQHQANQPFLLRIIHWLTRIISK